MQCLFLLGVGPPLCAHMYAFQSLETIDSGKPFNDALPNIQKAANFARYFAGLADKVVGQTIPAGSSLLNSLQFLCLSLQCFTS